MINDNYIMFIANLCADSLWQLRKKKLRQGHWKMRAGVPGVSLSELPANWMLFKLWLKYTRISVLANLNVMEHANDTLRVDFDDTI